MGNSMDTDRSIRDLDRNESIISTNNILSTPGWLYVLQFTTYVIVCLLLYGISSLASCIALNTIEVRTASNGIY